jgi:hypothetical protein
VYFGRPAGSAIAYPLTFGRPAGSAIAYPLTFGRPAGSAIAYPVTGVGTGGFAITRTPAFAWAGSTPVPVAVAWLTIRPLAPLAARPTIVIPRERFPPNVPNGQQ